MFAEQALNASEPRPAAESEPAPRASDPLGAIALCLSGGGYRAMVYHLGALWRLNELGFLPRLARISSVSGGSITAAWLGVAWPRLGLSDQQTVSPTFVDEVVRPIRRLADRTIDWQSVARGILGRRSIGDRVVAEYRRNLFGRRTLQDLPADGEGPRFIINATNLQSGVLWRFSRPYMRDYRVGEVLNPEIELAVAVAASSAFPPFLSPVELPLEHLTFTDGSGKDLQKPPYTSRSYLTDGGVYDNLGLQTVLGINRQLRQPDFKTILVSDGGGKMKEEPQLPWDWGRHLLRVLNVVDNQVRSRRKIELIASFGRGEGEPDHHRGTYWGMRVNLASYAAANMLPCPPDKTLELAEIDTRLAKLNPITQERLINWGYASCDAAMRRWVDQSLPAPSGFPYPAAGVG